jgi:hypothetical protein
VCVLFFLAHAELDSKILEARNGSTTKKRTQQKRTPTAWISLKVASTFALYSDDSGKLVSGQQEDYSPLGCV